MAIINTKNGTTQLSDVGTYRNNIRKTTGRKVSKGKSTNINTSMDENKLEVSNLINNAKNIAKVKLIPAVAMAATGGSQLAGVIAANAMNLKLRIDADRLRELMELSQYLSFGKLFSNTKELIVSAVDGVLPKHKRLLKFYKLLGAKNIIVIMTKCKSVDNEILNLVMMEIKELIKDLGLNLKLMILNDSDDRFLEFSIRINSCIDKLNFSDYNLSPEALSAFRNLTIWKNKLELAKYNLKLAKASNNPVQMQASLSLIDLAKLLIAKYLNMYNQLKVK